jgi:hypothetical protein
MKHLGQVVMAGILFCVIASSSIARDRYLLLDDRIIEKAENAKLALGTVKKHPANPLFTEDKPWEKRFDNLYGNVTFDKEEQIYKCWYSPFIVDNSSNGMTLEERDSTKYRPPRGKREMGVCYATSKDGIKWDKPNLNQVEFEGNKENNIVLRGPHGAGVFKDLHTSDPSQRYKLVMKGVKTSTSADGVNWTTPVMQEEIGGAGDTHNNAFWSPTLNKYVLITRAWTRMFVDPENSKAKKRARVVSHSESADFSTWTMATHVIEPEVYPLQPYSMPTFYHGGVYLGIIAVHHQPPVDRVWPELAWSEDTKIWHRVCKGTPLIPLAEKKLDYDYGCIYTCANPIILKDEIRIYYGASDYLHYGWREGSLALATLRPDGFAGYEQESKDNPAVITTSSIPYAGQGIQLSADVMKGGEVNVTVLGVDGKPISKAKTISKTVTDGRLELSEKIDAKEIRLKFEATNAKLYSFSFEGK